MPELAAPLGVCLRQRLSRPDEEVRRPVGGGSAAVAGSASRRSVPPPNVWAILERSSAQRDGALIPGSNRRSSGPTPPVCLRRLRRPRSPLAGGIDPPAVVIPAGRRLDPECRPDAPPPPAAAPGYPLRCGVFALSPSCLRRTLWAPFFSGFHRLAVDDGRPFGKLRRVWPGGPELAATWHAACRGLAARFHPGAKYGNNGMRCAKAAGRGGASAKSSRCAARSGWR